ncbi:hypothetical protein L2089_07175 [Paenibacillus hunanensis]|uniref:hypothetical protein n=1 Tax=Paenibacillus hunanensis TaxID=539262 RepID=UPI002025C753|nr:hypothetical protein [Paenibacillus hunanensis]MCL9660462.1 hypothetical protein [Paenibacillus hunanensis]
MENTNNQNTLEIVTPELDLMTQLRQIVSNRENSDLAVRGKVTQLLNQYMDAN